MGVARRADASERQLDDGLSFLLAELSKLAAAYPEQAARLRIPARLEALDQRLSAAVLER